MTRATEQADPGTAARDCPESDSCPLGEGKRKEEAFKLIECVKLEERAGKRLHEDPILAIFRQVGQGQGKNPAEEPARQNLIAVRFLPGLTWNGLGSDVDHLRTGGRMAGPNSPASTRRGKITSVASARADFLTRERRLAGESAAHGFAFHACGFGRCRRRLASA